MTSNSRAIVLVTGTSLLVPVIGLATAPILTNALGTVGRGEAGAAIAPNLVIVGLATLGLPAALTYFVASRPHLARIALAWATLLALPVAALTVVGFFAASDYLSGGDDDLAHLMLIGAWLALPAILVGLFRGAAFGRQMWTAVAIERVINSVVRLVAFAGLAVVGRLDVTNAVLVFCIAPIVAGLAYAGLAARPAMADPDVTFSPATAIPALLAYGSREWIGSVAVMLMARASQLLVTPLSDVEQLGLLLVAITISDVPWIVTQAVREVIFGMNSAAPDTERLLATSRVATLVAVAGSAVLACTLPLWIGTVFGSGFAAAVVPTWVLLLASCVAVPGLIAGAGLDSTGRPGLRSAALGIALGVNVLALFVLVPPLGAVGAALASLLNALVSAVLMIVAASRLLGTAGHGFFVPRATDLRLLGSILRETARRVRPGQQEPDQDGIEARR